GMHREVRVDATLEVHLLPAREPLRNQHHLGQLAPQMPGNLQRQPGRARLRAQRLCRHLKQLAHATRQPPEILTVGSGRHGRGWGAHPANNARRALAVPTKLSSTARYGAAVAGAGPEGGLTSVPIVMRQTDGPPMAIRFSRPSRSLAPSAYLM